jgi:hypothetical protein
VGLIGEPAFLNPLLTVSIDHVGSTRPCLHNTKLSLVITVSLWDLSHVKGSSAQRAAHSGL